MKTISAVMSASPVVANTSNKFSQILRLFTEFPLHHLPIVDNENKLIGILSSNDLPKIFLSLCNRSKLVVMTMDNLDELVTVTDLMTANPITIGSAEPISKAAEIFAEKRFTSLPVVDSGILVGIVTLKDVVPYLNHVATAV